MMTIALIHPSARIVPLLTEVGREVMPDMDFMHIVDEGLQRLVADAGSMTEPVTRRLCSYARNAQEAGADAIVLTSPILGRAIDSVRAAVAVPAFRLDEAMADTAVQFGAAIGVLATASLTLDPTVALLRERALARGKEVAFQTFLCQDAGQALLLSGLGAYDEEVMKGLGVLTGNDVVVLADVLMHRVVRPAAERLGLPVLASPRPGFELLSKQLNYFRR